MSDITACLIGCGVVGNAMKTWLENCNCNVKVLVSDPAKGYCCNLQDPSIDAYFIQIHVPTLQNGKQDISNLIQIVKSLPEGKDIWIRTTILPSTLKQLKEINRKVHFMPEFLTERTAIEDFAKQTLIFTGNVQLLKKIFIGREFIQMRSEEACLAKYAHNVFGCLKVTYFNCIYRLCAQAGFNYSNVLSGVLVSKYINEVHTQVPGPDGKFGYGGKCFPKDIHTMCEESNGSEFSNLLSVIMQLNQHFRT